MTSNTNPSWRVGDCLFLRAWNSFSLRLLKKIIIIHGNFNFQYLAQRMFVLSAMDYNYSWKQRPSTKTMTVSVQMEWLLFNIPFFFHLWHSVEKKRIYRYAFFIYNLSTALPFPWALLSAIFFLRLSLDITGLIRADGFWGDSSGKQDVWKLNTQPSETLSLSQCV